MSFEGVSGVELLVGGDLMGVVMPCCTGFTCDDDLREVLSRSSASRSPSLAFSACLYSFTRPSNLQVT